MKIGLYLDKVSMHLLNKGLFVSCEPVDKIENAQPGLVDERLSEVGNYYLVCDLEKEIQGKAKLVDAFITTYGDPDPIILKHMGFENKVAQFKKEYAGLFANQFPNESLIDETELFVCIYEPIKDS
jgi:uncharacterized protein YhfF